MQKNADITADVEVEESEYEPDVPVAVPTLGQRVIISKKKSGKFGKVKVPVEVKLVPPGEGHTRVYDLCPMWKRRIPAS